MSVIANRESLYSSRESAVIYGAGGHARELRDQMLRDGWSVHAFVDDFDYGREVDGCPVLPFDKAFAAYQAAEWFIAIGDPRGRQKIASRLASQGMKLGTFVSRDALVSPSAEIETGAQVFARAIVSSGVKVGYCVIVNFGCVLSHDVELDEFATISPGVHIAGYVSVKVGSVIGVGASIKNGQNGKKLIIGAESIVGAGACIVKDTMEKTVVVGVPGRLMDK